jgi:hypothetical protein
MNENSDTFESKICKFNFKMISVFEFFIEVIIQRWIAGFLGIRVRWLFFNALGKKVTLEQLTGKKGDIGSEFSQNLFNAFAGIALLLTIFLIGNFLL